MHNHIILVTQYLWISPNTALKVEDHLHTYISFCMPSLTSFCSQWSYGMSKCFCLFCCLYEGENCFSHVCPTYNTVCNDILMWLIRFFIEMQTVQSFIPQQHASGHVHLCCKAVVPDVFSFCPCPWAGCLSEVHNERLPQPMSLSYCPLITQIWSKLSHYFISFSHR